MPLSVTSCSRHDLEISQMSGRKEGMHILWIVRIDKVYRPQTNHDALLTLSCIALLLILSIHSSMNLVKQRKDWLNLAVLLCNSLDIIKVTLDKSGAKYRTLLIVLLAGLSSIRFVGRGGRGRRLRGLCTFWLRWRRRDYYKHQLR